MNGIITDNRFENLRDVSRLINMQNRRGAQKGSTCGVLGVGYDRRRPSRPFYARIRVPGMKYGKFLGYFDTPDKASEVYLEAKRRLHDGCTI